MRHMATINSHSSCQQLTHNGWIYTRCWPAPAALSAAAMESVQGGNRRSIRFDDTATGAALPFGGMLTRF